MHCKARPGLTEFMQMCCARCIPWGTHNGIQHTTILGSVHCLPLSCRPRTTMRLVFCVPSHFSVLPAMNEQNYPQIMFAVLDCASE